MSYIETELSRTAAQILQRATRGDSVGVRLEGGERSLLQEWCASREEGNVPHEGTALADCDWLVLQLVSD